MSENRKQYFGTFGILESDDDSVVEYHVIAEDIERVRELIDNREKATRDARGHNTDISDAPQHKTEFGKLIWNSFKQLHSYYYLSIYITDVMPSMARVRFRREVVEFAKETFAIVEEYNGHPLYRFSTTELAKIEKNINSIDAMDRGASKIKFSILLSLVATFDSLFADACKFLLMQQPERYQGSDRAYTVSEILALNSIEEIISKVVGDEIDQLMAKSHSDQAVFFEKNFHVQSPREGERWCDYVEIFERRNLAAHGDLVINQRYIDNCTKAGLCDLPALGSVATINAEYVEHSVDIMIEFLVSILFSVWRKRVKDEHEEAFGTLIEVTFELLRDDHPEAAIRLCQFGLALKDSGRTANSTQMLIVNMAIGLRMADDFEGAKKLLDETDFSATTPLVKLGVACVRSDVEAAVALLEPAKLVDQIQIIHIRDWPVFQWMLREKEFCDKASEVFGEPVAIQADQHIISSNPDEADTGTGGATEELQEDRAKIEE